MKTLQLRGGDLVVGSGGHQTIRGTAMVAQDIRCALGEPLGNDRFHPGYGSTLSDNVGRVLEDGVAFEVQQEVMRVVGNYSAIQQDKITRDALSAKKARYSTDDVVADVDGISVKTNMDSISVSIGLTMLDGSAVPITTGVTA